MLLDKLINQIHDADGTLKAEANNSVNRLLTIRNWLIGHYIVNYEQQGEDKARYGGKLLDILSASLNIKGLSVTNLKLNRSFYLAYPYLREDVAIELSKIPVGIGSGKELEKNIIGIRQTLSDELKKNVHGISQTASDQFQDIEIELSKQIINKLSFSHIILLIALDDRFKRAFYALHAIKGTWSVRELKRQINSLFYERSGMSKKPEQLLQWNKKDQGTVLPTTLVKDIYTFEFLGLPAKDAIDENDLESALLDNLQQFLMELGHGFCLEARQKRILIGHEYFYIDLVFYNRLLKCHILIDLKVAEFNHNNAGQLNTYLNYYKKEVVPHGDNPPIGILLVTNKNEALVEYATAGMDEQLFVREYMLQLPTANDLARLIKEELKNF